MKKIRFKLDTVKCSECNSSFKVNKYKAILPIPRTLPKKHLPEHSCK